MGFLSEKRILITGISSKKSLAWGIAKAMHKQNAILGFTYQNDKLKVRIKKYAAELDSDIVLPCDVSHDDNIKVLFAKLKKIWNKFDGFVHAIAFAPTNQLRGDYISNINREDFRITHDISSYSFVAMAKECRSMLNIGSSIITLSYLGAARVIPNYNVMGPAKASLEANIKYMAQALGTNGIRVNGISAGPIRTIASSCIKDFRKILSTYSQMSPIRRGINIEDIGNTAAFLISELANGITGEIIHVDGGFRNIALMI